MPQATTLGVTRDENLIFDAIMARACSALIVVAREGYLIVAKMLYKGTERSKTVPNTLITMFTDLALRAAFSALQAVEQGLT